MKQTQGQLRVTFEGAPGEDANHALQRILELEKARIRDGERQSNAERGPFSADSMVSGGLKWVGFHVDIHGGGRTGAVTRWVAIHPDFPRRRRAFMVALDEETPQGARSNDRGADAIDVVRSLVPRGKGPRRRDRGRVARRPRRRVRRPSRHRRPSCAGGRAAPTSRRAIPGSASARASRSRATSGRCRTSRPPTAWSTRPAPTTARRSIATATARPTSC
jgi:hypothetical protein